jgi:hypothetical protein
MKKGFVMEYLARKGKPRVYHLFTGTDTVCRMYSTGGLKKQKYAIIDDIGERSLCAMCQNVAKKTAAKF